MCAGWRIFLQDCPTRDTVIPCGISSVPKYMCVCGVWGVCVTDLLRGLGTCRGQRTTDRSWFLLPCGSRYQTQVTNLGSQCPYCLRSLAHPMGSVSVTFIVVAVVKFLQCETTFYCQSEFCVSLLIFNPQLHFSD